MTVHRPDLVQYIKARIEIDPQTGCWNWQRHVTPFGYGQCSAPDPKTGEVRIQGAHRVSYFAFKGPIPDGLEPDHLCRNRRCVNPDHLEAVTRRENLLRGETIPAAKAAQTHCVNGHPFSEENTYRPRPTGRACRICKGEAYRRWVERNRGRRREIDRAFYARKKAAVAAMPKEGQDVRATD